MTETSNVVDLNQEPVTYEKFWDECYWKVNRVLAEAKWDAITGEGLSTRMLDKDSGQYVEVTLKGTPCELYEGMKRYRKDWPRNPDYSLKDPQYMTRPATWLNRGMWLDG